MGGVTWLHILLSEPGLHLYTDAPIGSRIYTKERQFEGTHVERRTCSKAHLYTGRRTYILEGSPM